MQALERSYDGIIIGAGQHGLVLGSYLAKAGLKVLLVERRLSYGGGLSTREVTQPGFYHNLHSINHFHITETPWFKDLGLESRVSYITPRYEFGQAHLDGTALVLGRDLEETIANIARFSRKDAATFRDWNRKAEAITGSILLPERYAEPLPQAEREALLARTALGRDFLAVTRRQPLEVVDELFENEHVKLLFLFKVSLFGTWLTDTLSKTSPMGSVIRAFDLQSGYQLCRGGSFNLARGLMETFIAAGGSSRRRSRIDRIVIEGGRATGIALDDGRVVRAKQFVASTIDVHQTFEQPDRARAAAAAAAIEARRLPIHRLDAVRPALGAAREPALCRGGLRSEHQSRAEMEHRRRHDGGPVLRASRRAGRTRACARAIRLRSVEPHRSDAGAAGKHTSYAWHVMPLDPDPGGNDYEAFKHEFSERILQTWARYCPNMTSKNIIGQYAYTAREYVAEFPNMRGGDIFMGAFNAEQVMYNHFGYRTPIPNLYYAGSAAHPGGAISGGSGYISAGIIARDLGVGLWWKPWDARAALAALPQAVNQTERKLLHG